MNLRAKNGSTVCCLGRRCSVYWFATATSLCAPVATGKQMKHNSFYPSCGTGTNTSFYTDNLVHMLLPSTPFFQKYYYLSFKNITTFLAKILLYLSCKNITPFIHKYLGLGFRGGGSMCTPLGLGLPLSTSFACVLLIERLILGIFSVLLCDWLDTCGVLKVIHA